MSKQHDTIARNIFQERIKKGLLGPGSDVFVDNNIKDDRDNEIISDYPLQRYYTGILYPEKERINLFSELAEKEIESETSEEINNSSMSPKNNMKDQKLEYEHKNDIAKEPEDDNELKISHNSFFPTNIGLTFCVDNSVKELDVEFSFGLYNLITKDIRIKASKEIFDEFITHPSFPFKEIISYEKGYLILKRKLKGKSKQPRSEEFAMLDDFKKSNGFKNSSLKNIFHYFEKLIGPRTWKRENIIIRKNIPVAEIIEPKTIMKRDITKVKENFFRASYTIKTYQIKRNPNNTYVKIQLVNTSSKHPAEKFSNSKEQLNEKSIFQAKIKVNAYNLKPYKSYIELNPLDKEAEILNYFYKDKSSYGIGHNCAVSWEETKNSIETTFLPQYDIKDIKNSFSKEDFEDNPNDFRTLNESLDIYNLSIFSNKSKKQTINILTEFIHLYGQWIEKQKEKPTVNKEIENYIFENLDYNFDRLKRNISLLNNDTIYKAFRFSNTAMLIQIIISNHKEFSGKEKDLSDLKDNINYNDIDFFKNYNFERPKYRPFQLAFLLLNLDGITDLNSKARNKIVDLICFPTGGGKTEAYLAIAAFTIIYRRLMNKTGFGGTSVIMRYTLRLLTTQQFERASKLIVSLEFLRGFFETELKNEQINIGMWVGMSSSPNSVEKALEQVEKINEECNKNKGDPEDLNVFQVSSCPWCGTKLISKNKYGNWIYGFEKTGKSGNSGFKIKCLNERCPFHDELPVQVVDEMLYENPPTLLFGTVDKFAMLAWQAKGHRFFNSLDENKLPPDLIIQDELHLLTGPLGSITGFFESVIEILCTKNKRKPKIIASTATTRNTNSQIKALYGNSREVNIFPPSGLSYNDSFFEKVSKTESRRRYLGFIPTGKSSIDTQLQVLANLFVARLEVYKTIILNGENDFGTFDKYWTLVSYYNSLKDVGRIHNKIGDEISNFTSSLQIRLYGYAKANKFNYAYLNNRDVELTSRVDSSKIKRTLELLEENNFNEKTIKESDNGNTYVKGVVDLVLATNMISVGIDIDRFNIILINGQPRNIAEYIQVSSRIGRKFKGLVIDLLDANRARDKSHFEHFVPFHQAFYKSVEPISLTPFTENTLEKMLTSIMITYVRHKIKTPPMSANDMAGNFKPEMLQGLNKEIRERFIEYPKIYSLFEEKLQKLSNDWLNKIEKHDLRHYKEIKTKYRNEMGLLAKPADKNFDINNLWTVMQSMREIDTNSFIKIELPKI